MHTEVVLAKHLASDAPISSLISFLIHLSFSDLYMDFGHAGFVDARQCTFNQVGRDQIYNRTQYYISISPFCSRQRPYRITNNLSQPRRSGPIEGSHVITHQPDATPNVNTTAGLIDQTIPSLNCRYLSNGCQDLAPELESLHQTLTLIKLTLQKYKDTLLGQSLANMITKEVKQCSAALQKLWDSLDDTWLNIRITSISGLWRRIWCGDWDEVGLALSRKTLSVSRQSLQVLLVTLHSYVALFPTLSRLLKSFQNR